MASPDPASLIAQATQAYRAQQFDESFHDFERAAAGGRPAEGYYGMGVILHDRGQLDAAESYLLKSLAANNMNADAYYHLGSIAEKRQRYEEAQRNYAQAIRFNPKYEAVIRQRSAVVAGAAAPPSTRPPEPAQGVRPAPSATGSSPAPQPTNNPMEAELGVYEFLRGDATTPNLQAIQVIRLLKGQIQPRPSAYIDVLIVWSFAALAIALFVGSLVTVLTYRYVGYAFLVNSFLIALVVGVTANYDHIGFQSGSRHWLASIFSVFLRGFVILAWLGVLLLPVFSSGIPGSLIPNPLLAFILGLFSIAIAIALVRYFVRTTHITVDKRAPAD